MLRKIGLWDSEFTANNKLGTFIWPEKKCHYWHRFLHDETSKQIRGMWPVKCCPEVSPRRLTVGNVTKCRVSSRSRLSSLFGIQLVVGSGAVRTVIWETTGYLTECFTWGQRARRLVLTGSVYLLARLPAASGVRCLYCVLEPLPKHHAKAGGISLC